MILKKIIIFLSAILFPLFALAEEHEAHTTAVPDIKLLFSEINFIALLILLYFLLRRPLQEYFASRSSQLRKAVEEARFAHAKAVQENEAIQKRLQLVEKEAADLMRSFKEEGKLESSRILDQAGEYSVRLKEDAKRIADSELKKAKEQLKEVTIQLAQNLAEKSIQREMNEDDEARLTLGYVRSLKELK